MISYYYEYTRPVALGTDQTPSAQNWHRLNLDATPMHQMQDIFLLMAHDKLREFPWNSDTLQEAYEI